MHLSQNLHILCAFKSKLAHTLCTFKPKFAHTLCANKPCLQKILGSCGLNGHIMEIRLGVTLEDNDGQRRTTECEDRARILDAEFAMMTLVMVMMMVVMVVMMMLVMVMMMMMMIMMTGTPSRRCTAWRAQ